VRVESVVRVEGPLAVYADGFSARLAELGYTRSSTEDLLRLMAHLSRWLAEHGGEAVLLTPEVVQRFMRARRAHYVALTGAGALDGLLRYLRELGVVPDEDPSVARTPVELLVGDYCDYLVREQGLVAGSVRLRERTASMFLGDLPEPIELALQQLQAGAVTAFVLRECRRERRGVASAKTLVSGLRSLLRFLHVAGWIPIPLVSAVPSVAGWRMSSLPRALDRDVVAGLLESCDRSKPAGRRDFAILTLLARLGLRGHEVSALCLEDIDWRAGEMRIRGKGSRIELLPLPNDVGESLVDYLRHGRVHCGYREVFLRAHAPQGALSAPGVRSVVRHACDRAGLPHVGGHRLRHTVATEMLRAGAPLHEIAQVLRHASPRSTAIYAKVDRVALRMVARPWPGDAA
jgi:integrase/recombinase XerD